MVIALAASVMQCSSSMTDKHRLFLSLGANIGDRHATIMRAVEQIDKRVGTVTAVSSIHETEPWGFNSANKFLNAAIQCATILSPREVLATTQAIERELGRERKSSAGQYHDRLIDIDILLYDDVIIDEVDLKIPHPLMRQRDFVMKPLSEIL